VTTTVKRVAFLNGPWKDEYREVGGLVDMRHVLMWLAVQAIADGPHYELLGVTTTGDALLATFDHVGEPK
jgi:hypothetical protein